MAQVLPNATKIRRVGLVTYGPGPYNQCNVKLVMRTVDALVPVSPLTDREDVATLEVGAIARFLTLVCSAGWRTHACGGSAMFSSVR